MKILFVADPLSAFNTYKDSTFAMMREAPGQRLPAIALTAFTRDVDRQQALQAGFDAHLSKPLRPQQLLRMMAQLTQSG